MLCSNIGVNIVPIIVPKVPSVSHLFALDSMNGLLAVRT